MKQKSKENSKSSLRASKSSDSPPKRNLQSSGATKEISSISTIQLEKKGRENPQVFWKTVTTAFTLLLQILVNPLHFTNSSGDQKKLSCTVVSGWKWYSKGSFVFLCLELRFVTFFKYLNLIELIWRSDSINLSWYYLTRFPWIDLLCLTWLALLDLTQRNST